MDMLYNALLYRPKTKPSYYWWAIGSAFSLALIGAIVF